MGKKYEQLSPEERCTISLLQREGKSIRQIGATLARSPSTISREIKRNTTRTLGYKAKYAQIQTIGRRWRGSRLERQSSLRDAVLNRLVMGWSPQQISQRLAQDKGSKVISHESIYRFIYSQLARTKDYRWRHYLPRGKSRRGFRGRKGGSSASYIKHRTSIHDRPSEVSVRQGPGHWEADLMLFSKYGQALLVAHERYSRLVILYKLDNKQAKPIAFQLRKLFEKLSPEMDQSITFDNGSEFSEHHQLKQLGMNTYFCDVSAPWQKGGVENAIGRLRRYLPRKTDITTLGQTDLRKLALIYNQTPRKCLNYKMPSEVFLEQLLHFKCELTFPPARE